MVLVLLMIYIYTHKSRYMSPKKMNLPKDMLMEILVRLPVKSLLRFQSVSKTFFSLISDPGFAALHHKHPKRIRTHNILLPTSTGLLSLDPSNTTSFTDQDALTNLNLSFKTPDSTGLVRIVGSCNGLVCLCLDRYRRFLIWNPSTGSHTKLPDPCIHYANDIAKCVYGFGYDPSTNDYKVFLAVGPDFLSFINNHVFTTKTGSWRKFIRNFNFRCCEMRHWHPAEQGLFLNGALHWLMALNCRNPIHGYYSDSREVIIAFDIAEENFREVPMPNVDLGSFPRYQYFNNLGILEGCLCLISWARRNSVTVDLWMMRDYGVQSSWEKLFRVAEYVQLFPCGLVPLSFTGCGELILVSHGNELIRFNPDIGRIHESLVIDNIRRYPPELPEATLYMETLISPNFLKKNMVDLCESCGVEFPGCDYRPEDRKNWMKGLNPEKVHINKILWPGTHDSTNKIGIPCLSRPSAQCQSLSIYHQLVRGTRVLDIRVRKDRKVCHGIQLTYSIDVVINDIKKFLSETESEIIVLEIRTEFGHKDPPDFEKYLEEKLREFLIHQDDHVFGKTIAEVLPRRVICVWKPRNSPQPKRGGPLWSAGYLKDNWTDTDLPATKFENKLKHLREQPPVLSRKFFYRVENTVTQADNPNPVLSARPVTERFHGCARLFVSQCVSKGCADRLQIYSTDFIDEDFVDTCVGFTYARVEGKGC